MSYPRFVANSVVAAAIVLAVSSRTSVTIVRASSAAQTSTPMVSAPRDLGTLGGSYSRVTHLSESGVVAGTSALPGDVGESAFAWTEATGMVALSLPGGYFSQVSDVNDSGMVVGITTTPAGQHGFVWTLSRGLIDIGTLGGTRSFPQAVNNSGIVVGTSTLPGDGIHHAFMWTEENGMIDLGAFGESHAAAISDSGIIVGQSYFLNSDTGFYEAHAFAWTADSGIVDLGSLSTDPFDSTSSAMAVNDSGLVAGYSWADDRTFHAFVWKSTDGMVSVAPNGYAGMVASSGVVLGQTSVIGQSNEAFAWTRWGGTVKLSLGGAYSTAFAVNDTGTVVGAGNLANSPEEYRAFVWNPGTGLVDLGFPDGFVGSAAYAINNHGVVVGIDLDGGSVGGGVAFAWTQQHGRISFPSSSRRTGWIDRINDAGTIAGTTIDPSTNNVRATIWTIDFAAPANVAPTPVGSGVSVEPTATLPDGSTAPVSLSFASVLTGGATTVETSTAGPPLPGGFKLGQPPIYYDVETTAVFSGAVTLCFTWQEGQLHNEGNARLLHFENNAWLDVTTSVDVEANRICGSVTSLSPFAIAEIAYTFGGFDQPLLGDGSASIQQTKTGRTIPVKFTLTWQGQPAANATATIAVYKVLDTATGTIDTTELTEDAGAANDTGNAFRYGGDGKYVFNLSTKNWPAPATYRIIVTLSDGSVYSVDFSLR